MGLCFATGSRQTEKLRHALRVLHGVEYLRYDIPNQRVDVAADFFVQNESDQPASLRGLHPGSVRFETRPVEWLRDDHWTSLLRRIVAEKIGVQIGNDNAIYLCQGGHNRLAVSIATGELGEWWPTIPPAHAAAPYTGWTGPIISPGGICVFSLFGTIEGETYSQLMPSNPAVDGITIMGGVPLIKAMKLELAKRECLDKCDEYATAFDDFEKEFLRDPNFYHVLFERVDGQPFKPVYVSSETWRGCLNYRVDKRCVSWYWSDRELDIAARANGPVLELLPTDSENSANVAPVNSD